MKYESQLEYNTARARGNHENEDWRICPSCLDAFVGMPGDECRVCGGVTQVAPLFDVSLDKRPWFICDACGWKAVGKKKKIGRFIICERCVKINDDIYPDRFVKPEDVVKIKKEIERAVAITELMEAKNA